MKKLLYLLFIIFSLSASNAFAEYEITVQSIDSFFTLADSDIITEEQQSVLRDCFKTAIDNHEETADISAAQIEHNNNNNVPYSVFAVFVNLANDTPEYFNVDLSKTYSFSIQNNVIISMPVYYVYDFETASERLDLCEQRAQEIIDEMNTKNITSDLDMALYIHDYLVINCEYHTEAASNPNSFKGHGMDAALIDGMSVCQGYANSYKFILNKLGVECVNVYTDTGRHQWSMVNIDGNWYHVDVTHDDPTPDKLGYVSHDHFLLTDKEIENLGLLHSILAHSDWYITDDTYTSTAVNSPFSDVHWRNATTEIAFTDNFRYYTVYYPYSIIKMPKTCIVKCDENFEIIDEEYFTINDLWYSQSGNGTWGNFFSGLSEHNNYLYYNTGNKLVRIDTLSDTPTAEVIYTYEPEASNKNPKDTYLFGSYISDGKLYYAETLYNTKGYPSGTDNDNKMVYDLADEPIPTPVPTPAVTVDSSQITVDSDTHKISGTVTADVVLEDEEAEKAAEVYFAVYENGILKHIEKTLIYDTRFDIDIEYRDGNEYTYKLFVWNNSLVPFLPIVTDTLK